MAEKIKKFFAKKKTDAKFKLAGPGHRLNESSTAIVGPSKQKQSYVAKPSVPTDAKIHAAEAALARMGNQNKTSAAFNTSLAAIQAQVRRELDAEKKNATETVPVARPMPSNIEASPHLAVKGI